MRHAWDISCLEPPIVVANPLDTCLLSRFDGCVEKSCHNVICDKNEYKIKYIYIYWLVASLPWAQQTHATGMGFPRVPTYHPTPVPVTTLRLSLRGLINLWYSLLLSIGGWWCCGYCISWCYLCHCTSYTSDLSWWCHSHCISMPGLLVHGC